MTVDGGRFDLQRAIVENELVLYYQPIVRASDRVLTEVEALVRWRHPQRGILPPSAFVPTIERAGLARELTLWVLREAILQAAVWRSDKEPLVVGVNLSPENLRDALFRRFLDITLRAVGQPELLVAELPAATLTAPEQLESLQRMRDKRIKVAVDDLVAPESLGDVPADAVKIGRALVARLAFDDRAVQDARTIVSDAHELGRTVTAVGVEDDLTWRRAVDVGCDQIQGFVVAPALSTAELDAWRHRR